MNKKAFINLAVLYYFKNRTGVLTGFDLVDQRNVFQSKDLVTVLVKGARSTNLTGPVLMGVVADQQEKFVAGVFTVLNGTKHITTLFLVNSTNGTDVIWVLLLF